MSPQTKKIARYILAAILMVGGAWTLFGHAPWEGGKALDGAALSQELSKELAAQYSQPAQVACPHRMPVGAGKIYDCTLAMSGQSVLVRVTMSDDQGHVRWEVTSQTAS